MKMTTHLHLTPRLRMSVAILLLGICLHGAHMNNFTFYHTSMRTEWEGKSCVLSIQRIITEERNSKTYPILESDISDREAVRW